MIEMLLVNATGPQGGMGYRPVPSIQRRAQTEGRPLPRIGGAGTGGVENAEVYRMHIGYQSFFILEAATPVEQAPFKQMMHEVKEAFGRTMTRLPEVFGVSRQTLYNWLDGETPKPAHQAKLRELAEAARVFSALGFKPNSLALERIISQGKSLLELLRDGGSGRDAAKQLVRLSQRGTDSRARLEALLGGRKARPDASDLGAPALNEDV